MTLAVGTGVVVGAAAAEDRGVSGVYSDTKIRTQINYRWLKHESILMESDIVCARWPGSVNGWWKSRRLRKKPYR